MPLADEFQFSKLEDQVVATLRLDDALPIILPKPRDISVPRIVQEQDIDTESAHLVIACLRFLENECPSIHHLVSIYTKIIHLKSNEEIEGYTGLSDQRRSGSIELTNFAKLGTDPKIAAAAIIHEGIHQYLVSIEEEYGYFVSEASMVSDKRVRSPWTGSDLFLENITHAAAVWFGLYHYWRQLCRIGHNERECCIYRDQITKIKRGFESIRFLGATELLDRRGERRAVGILKTLGASLGG